LLCPPPHPVVGFEDGGGREESPVLHVGELVPPFAPIHDQVHGPAPFMAVGVPCAQRFTVGPGADITVPFADPHIPFTGTGAHHTVITILHVAVHPDPVHEIV
jgi:hypothetical protein